MRPAPVLFAVWFASTSWVVSACNDGTDFRGLGMPDSDGAAGDPAKARTGVSAQATCGGSTSPPDAPLDPASLAACSPACGGAHCVPTDKVPEPSRPYFASCGAGYCVPDPLISSGGAKPPSCTSLGGARGVCLGLCVPQVADNKDVLPQATCATDERCAPCNDPKDGTSTGACSIGLQLSSTPSASCSESDGGASTASVAPADTDAPDLTCPHVGPPVVEPSTLPACGGAGSGAHCMPVKDVPAQMASQLGTCGTGLCAPDKLIAAGGRFIPKTCSSIGGAEGRCGSLVIPAIAAQASQLPSAGCDANERCAPCVSPLDGKDTGVCHTSCDPGPTSPPVIFPACCGNAGKCVPRSLVPANEAGNLTGNGCAGGSLCAPNENLDPNFVAPACQSNGFFGIGISGTCVSNCVDLGAAGEFGGLSQGTCSAGHTCVSQ